MYSKINVMLIVSLNSKGIVHHKYAPQGQIYKQQLYLQMLKCPNDAFHHNQLQMEL